MPNKITLPTGLNLPIVYCRLLKWAGSSDFRPRVLKEDLISELDLSKYGISERCMTRLLKNLFGGHPNIGGGYYIVPPLEDMRVAFRASGRAEPTHLFEEFGL